MRIPIEQSAEFRVGSVIVKAFDVIERETSMSPIFTVPGINNSGPDHWQSIWERTHQGVTRVEQTDWDHPRSDEWIAAVENAVANAAAPPVIVAHSLGCLTAMQWCVRSERAVAGLILVAVPDPAGPNFPGEATGFSTPDSLRNRRTIMIASDNDPYATLDWARALANRYAARLVTLKGAGHINAASGLGAWSAGWRVVAEMSQGAAIRIE